MKIMGFKATLLLLLAYGSLLEGRIREPQPFHCTKPVNESTTRQSIIVESPFTVQLTDATIKQLTSISPTSPPCAPNMVLGPSCDCERTCQDPTSCNCIGPETCVCPDNFLTINTDCVPEQDCGCYYDKEGLVIPDGTTYVKEDCSEKCTCSNNVLSCDSAYTCSPNAECRVEDAIRQCYCNDGYLGDGETCKQCTDCFDAYQAGYRKNGVFIILPYGWPESAFDVYCDMKTNGGGWTAYPQLQALNAAYIWPRRLRMKTLVMIMLALRFGMLVASLDFKDAESHVPITPGFQRFITYKYKAQTFKFTPLAFCLSMSPWVFILVSGAVVTETWRHSITLFTYLVNCFILGDLEQQMLQRRRYAGFFDKNSWQEYKNGFNSGYLSGNHWLGNDKIFYLTNQRNYTLRFDLVSSDNSTTSWYQEYSLFKIANQSDNYRLIELGSGNGTAGDGMIGSLGRQFSTIDRDNDGCDDYHCSKKHGDGGWWYSNEWCDECCYSDISFCFDQSSTCPKRCTKANLNSYYTAPIPYRGFFWNDIHNIVSTEMKIRPTTGAEQ